MSSAVRRVQARLGVYMATFSSCESGVVVPVDAYLLSKIALHGGEINDEIGEKSMAMAVSFNTRVEQCVKDLYMHSSNAHQATRTTTDHAIAPLP